MNLKEIAKEANVSPSTVTMVIHNRPGVSDKTRERIHKLLQENGYSIAISDNDENEQNLVANPHKNKNIYFLKFIRHGSLVNGNAGFVSSIIDSVERESRKRGFNLVMIGVNPLNIEEVINSIKSQPPSGILFLATEFSTDLVGYLEQLPKPFVAIDNFMPNCDINSVNMNNSEAIHSSIKHLVELGHKKIGYLYNNMPSSNCEARLKAYEESLTYFGLNFDHKLVYRVPPDLTTSSDYISSLIEKGQIFPPALMTTNDTIAIGAMRAFKKHKIRVPADISLIGFDDIVYSAVSDPPLTTIHISTKEMGIWAVRLLCSRMHSHDSSPVKLQVSGTLVNRKSTGPAKHSIKPAYTIHI